MPDLERMKHFVLVIGNSRSGSTLLGSILDAHPNALVAHETRGSSNFWRNLDRRQILDEIAENSQRNRETGRMSEGYQYLIDPAAKDPSRTYVIGDKVWNPATLLLHGDFALLPRLEGILGVPIKIIHAIRNPFDVIATMHARSKAPIPDRTRWYFMHCEAALAIREKWEPTRYLDFHHESLFADPAMAIAQLCKFLELPPDEAHIQACKRLLFSEPKKTRMNLAWTESHLRQILARMRDYDFLEQYAGEDYSTLASVRLAR